MGLRCVRGHACVCLHLPAIGLQAFHGAPGRESTAYAGAVEEASSDAERFTGLFEGLAAQADAAEAAADDMLVEDAARAAWAQVQFADRLRAARAVAIDIVGHGPVSGDVVRVGSDAVLVSGVDGEWLVPLRAITSVTGLGEDVVAASAVDARLGFASVARAWARDRDVVRLLRMNDEPLDGTIDRVGADHLDLAEHDPGIPRRGDAVRRVVVVPFAIVSAMRRR